MATVDDMKKDVNMSLGDIKWIARCIGDRVRVKHREQNEEGTATN